MLQYRLGQMKVPILWEMAFLIAARIWPQHTLYTQLLFFLGLIFWFRGDFSWARLWTNVKRGREFWLPVAATLLGVFVGHRAMNALSETVFSEVADGALNVWTNSSFTLFLYAISTVFLMPVAEELFFRRAFLCFSDKGALTGTFIISILLYALSHALHPAGILEYVLVGLPLAISFVLTRNVYVPMLAHMIFNAIVNIPDILYVVARMLLR